MSSASPLTLGVAGALGRMGRAVVAQAQARDGLEARVLFDRADLVGTAIGDQTLQTADAALASCAVIIDFSAAEASVLLAEAAATGGAAALVIGSTGFSEAQDDRIAQAARRVAIVKSGNYSLGVNVLLGLVERGAAALGAADYDLEIFEAHHRRKVDAPSGTALMLGEAAARGRGVDLAQASVRVDRSADLAMAQTRLVAFELPWDGIGGGDTTALFAAVSSTNAQWSGSGLYVDTGDGALPPIGASGRQRSTIGTATNALGVASSFFAI